MPELSPLSRKLSYFLAPLFSLFFFNSALAGIYLSNTLKDGFPVAQPKDTFNCTDKIYGVIAGQWPADSVHLMEAYWTDPQGKQREHTRYKFTARKGTTHSWAWLLLHPAKPGLVDQLLMQDNDSLREFNGQWQVDFYIDGKAMGKLTFQLICG